MEIMCSRDALLTFSVRKIQTQHFDEKNSDLKVKMWPKAFLYGDNLLQWRSPHFFCEKNPDLTYKRACGVLTRG